MNPLDAQPAVYVILAVWPEASDKGMSMSAQVPSPLRSFI